MLRTALFILSGNAATSALLLARNLLLARLIPVADYGVAATFAMVMAVLEMASTLELHQQIVQSPRGNDPRFQAALQGFQVLRGTLSAMALLVLAGPIANFMGIPQATSAYRWLALIPLLNALQHFDIHRAQRSGRYLPVLLTGTLPAFGALLALWPLASIFGDWRAALWAMLIYTILGVITSHLMAERRYQLRLDRAEMRQSMQFGAPLLVNAAMMYLVFQGDKVIVGRLAGMEALAIFAMGVTLTLTPTLIGAKTIQNFFLPKLAAARAAGRPDVQRHLAKAAFEAALLTGSVLVLGVFLLGTPVIHLLLGAKYASLSGLLIPFAVLQAVRVAKTGPTVVALSVGQSSNGMWGNLPRVLILPVSYLVLRETGSFVFVIWLSTAAEAVGLALTLWRLHRVSPLPRIPAPLLTSALTLISITVATHFAPLQGLGVKVDLLMGLALIGMHVLSMRGLRFYFGRRLPDEI